MGVHTENEISIYWNTDFNKGPLHTIALHMPLRRYQQIKRFCHISDPYKDQSIIDPKWWYKVEPLASEFQKTFQ
jgi:hypothetical protein